MSRLGAAVAEPVANASGFGLGQAVVAAGRSLLTAAGLTADSGQEAAGHVQQLTTQQQQMCPALASAGKQDPRSHNGQR